MSVYDLKKDEIAIIVAINVVGAAATRLNSLNISVGKRIRVIGFSLFKSSVLISCGAIRLGMRKNFAKKIEVKYES